MFDRLRRDLSWGLGVSLGGSALFECLPDGDGAQPKRVLLNSGDLLVGDFGTMRHAVRVPKSSVAPEWWHRVDTFGQQRCNVLFRQALTPEEQRRLAEQRAIAIHGVSLEKLQARTGSSFEHLCVSLRHAALE